MYSPTTRLLTVLELLQSHQYISGKELASRLEVDGRTVRRYITQLQDMGIPVEGERGPHGAYQLQRGFKLPPLMFTDDQAIALILGLIVLRAFRFPVPVAALEGALAKTERVMPEMLLQQVRSLQSAITFNVTTATVTLPIQVLSQLSLAVQQEQRVRLRYQNYNGETSEREVDPYGIVFNEGYWYTAGYCHLRQDVRTFRLDRVLMLELKDATFQRPERFNVLDYVLQSLTNWPSTDGVEVLMFTTLERAQELIDPAVGTLEVTEQGVILRRPAYDLEWTALYLMKMEFPVRVLKPDSLRDMIRQMAQKALAMVGDY